MAARGATSEAIVHAFIKKYPEVIVRENAEIVFSGLMKFVGHVGAIRPGSSPAAQQELFAEYAIKRTIVFPMADGSNVHRQVQSLTVAEGHEYVRLRTQPRARVTTQVTEFARMLDDVEPYKVSDQSTIGDCWKSLRESRGG